MVEEERELEGFEEREGTRKRRELGGIRGERRDSEGRKEVEAEAQRRS